jgi:hypothetical protein
VTPLASAAAASGGAAQKRQHAARRAALAMGGWLIRESGPASPSSMAVRRAPAQRSVGSLAGRPPRQLASPRCLPEPRAVTVRGSVKRNELDIRTALKHATDQGKVGARGPQPGPRGHVSVSTVEQQNRRDPHSRDDFLRGFIEAVGPRAEALDSNFRRLAARSKPAAHAPNVNLEQFGGVSPRQPSRGQQHLCNHREGATEVSKCVPLVVPL